MILLIDAGNTRVKIAWLAAGTSRPCTPPLTLDHAELPGLAARLDFIPARILGSNVAGHAVRDTLERACHDAWGLPVRWHDTRDGHDLLLNGYRQPAQLGIDRWLGLLGLLRHVRGEPAWQAGAPCILASFGTATTVDTLAWQAQPDGTRRAAFIGGLILPGAALMARSLSQGTAGLPLARGEPADFPADTDTAIASGIAAAQAGALLRQWRLAADAYPGTSPLLFVSGGDWPRVQGELQSALSRACPGGAAPLPHWLDSPVLDGLASLAAPELQAGPAPRAQDGGLNRIDGNRG
ncbi:type III pantothenate kinase [Castellaniella sp.]|jgi:type III pantothenate kinase|uniref:type III pantothenate kinase n=1 Tax=Castellaniella sp. TaxID=1955812 RepID=UPI002D7F5C09|nr:type III pantothenate kinase [Castellaniella sp.]HET8703093.1 type III pantothenate kinase [Castellaniella sp.]